MNIILIFVFVAKLNNSLNLRKIDDIYDDPEYGDTLEGINQLKYNLDYESSKNPKDKKTINLFSDIYEKPNQVEITANAANLLKDNEDTNKSFIKLNAIINNVKGGLEALKFNPMLKAILTLILNDHSKSHNCRVKAAKLSARLNDIPVTYQLTDPDQKKFPKSVDSYVTVPRTKRLYRNDYYIENYKAGNWEP